MRLMRRVLRNRSWRIYVALVTLSIVAPSCGQLSDRNDLSSEEVEVSLSGEQPEPLAASADASNASKSALRHTEKELALCSATLMAVETREKMLKEQSAECQTSSTERSNDQAKAQSLECAQRIQQLERSFQEEREQMQLKLSHHTRLMNQYHEEVLRTNQQLRQQIDSYRQQLSRIQNELFTLRYEYHQLNEAQRQKQAFFYRLYDALRDHVWIPLLDWLRDPLWDRLLHPHVVVPLEIKAKQALLVMREYFDRYFPILHRHWLATWKIVSRQYVEPALQSLQRFTENSPHMVKFWIKVGELSVNGQEWFRSNIAPSLLLLVERFGVVCSRTHHTLSDALFIVGSSLEQWFRSKWGMSQGKGPLTAVYNVALSIFQSSAALADGNELWILVMAVVLLVHLIRQRRQRYIE